MGKPIYYAAPEVQVLDNFDATDNKIPPSRRVALRYAAGRSKEREGRQGHPHPERHERRRARAVDPRSGTIGLQDHGHAIWFRNIQNRKL